MRKGSVVQDPDGATVTIAARVPPDVARRLDEMAERSGLGRADIVRLALMRMPDDLVPPELIAAADVIRDSRRVR